MCSFYVQVVYMCVMCHSSHYKYGLTGCTDAFCYGKSVRQFHEIRTQRGPQEDPNTHSYVLGQYPAATSKHEGQGNAAAQIQSGAAEVVQANTEVGLGASGLSDVLSADSDIEFEEDSDTGKRYLVQHWTGGTSCDMTGLERKVEVQVGRRSSFGLIS